MKVRGESINFSDKLLILLLFFSAFASLFSDSLNRIALYVAVPIAFLLTINKIKSLRVNRYTNCLFFLFGWITLSYLWTVYQDPAKVELHRVLGAFLLSYIMAGNARNIKLIPWLYIVYIVLYLGAWYYVSQHIIVDVSAMNNEMDRLNDAKLNANTMAYYTFFATYTIYILGIIYSNRMCGRIANILFLFTIPLSFYVALTTASRQVLLIQIPLISLLMYDRYLKGEKIVKKMFFFVLCLLVLFFSYSYILSMYENSYLAVRVSGDLKDDARTNLLFDALDVGFKHFPLGVGAGNYIMYSYNHHFSHNSFVEVFVNQGIVGFLLYFSLLFIFVRKQFNRYRYSHDRMYWVFGIFGIIYIIDSFFYVFFTDLWLISFFILVATHSETYYINKK